MKFYLPILNVLSFRFLYRFLILSFAITIFFSLKTFAYPDGVNGRTTSGCTCHSTLNTATTITAYPQSGKWSFLPNTANTIIVTLHNATLHQGGIDIGIKTTSSGETNAGTLNAISSYLKLKSGELVSVSGTNFVDSLQFSISWIAPATMGTYYLKAAGLAGNNNGSSSGDIWNLLAPQAIVVEKPASISLNTPNGGDSLCPGSSLDITWTSAEITNVKIELSSDGGNTYPTTLVASTPAAAGSWTWNIPMSQTIGSNYMVRISDVANSSMNDVSNSSFVICPFTAITSQPQSLTVCNGNEASFNVSAIGGSLYYQWRMNGQNIKNANSSTYTINSASNQVAGKYDCVVTGICGDAVYSSEAVLTVDMPPSITSQPADVSGKIGDNIKLTLTATGIDLSYQWQKDAVDIPNATQKELMISNLSNNDAGNYLCIVTNKCGIQKSRTAKVTITEVKEPVITYASTNLDFDKTSLNQPKDSIFVAEITNSGNSDLIISNYSITGSDASDFQLIGLNFPVVIKPTENLNLEIKFTPKSIGQKTANLIFESNAKINEAIQLSGFGVMIKVTAEKGELQFLFKEIGKPVSNSVSILNKSNISLKIDLEIGGNDSEVFSIKSEKSFVLEVNIPKTCEIIFNPVTIEDKQAMLKISHPEFEPESLTVVTLTAINTTGIDEIYSGENITIAPNPANDDINIIIPETPEENLQYYIYDANGNFITNLTVNNKQIPNKILRWNLTDDSGKKVGSGLYNLMILSGKKKIVKQFIIVR